MRALLTIRLPLRAAALTLILATALGLAAATARAGDAAPARPVDQVVQWNRTLLGILRTPGAQPATVHATRNLAILQAAMYGAVDARAVTSAPSLVSLQA